MRNYAQRYLFKSVACLNAKVSDLCAAVKTVSVLIDREIGSVY